ncbi:MAG: hypothetical protein AAFO81_07260 [Pseudomonadota bacterium]
MTSERNEQRWLEQFDRALEAYVTTTDAADTSLRDRVIRRLNRQRWVRAYLPLAAFGVALLIAGGQLWQFARNLTAALPSRSMLNELGAGGLLDSLQQVPAHVWIVSAALLLAVDAVAARR